MIEHLLNTKHLPLNPKYLTLNSAIYPQVRNWIPLDIDIIEHLLNWHKNGSTFDLTLDYEQTCEVIRIMYEKQPANRK